MTAPRTRLCRLCLVPVLAAALAALVGCTVRNVRRINGTGSLADTPAGPTAVLRVTAADEGSARTGGATWGLVKTPNADRRFAEFVAEVGRSAGGLEMLSPQEVEQKLETESLEPTLQPDPEQVRRFAEALGVASYIVAHVEHSRTNYRFFLSWGTVAFTLACYAPGAEQPAWSVQVLRKARYKPDRETMALALREAFEWLDARPPEGAEQP